MLGHIEPTDPKAPPIKFEVNLPVEWNGRAVQYGGGGFNGTLITGLTRPFGIMRWPASSNSNRVANDRICCVMSQIVRKKLQAGDLISTGTFFSPPVRPAPGQSYAVRYEGLLNLVELDQVTGGNDQDAWSVAVALAPIPVVGQVAILIYIATDVAQRIYHNLKK